MTNAAKDIATQTTETTQPERLLDKLLAFEPAATPVISLYLDARVDEHGKRNFLPLFREQMPKTLSEKVVDAVSLGIDTPEHELLDETMKVFKRHDSITDAEKVERLLNEYRADDLGVAGVAETLAALSNGQVEEMLIVASADKLQYDEEEVKKVLELYQPDQPLPETLDPRTIADELVRRANLLSSARVTFIEDDTRPQQLGGVGGILRYRISEENAVVYEDSAAVPRSKALTTQA